MATALGTTRPTLLNLAKRQDPSGGLAEIVDTMSQSNEILQHMPYVEANSTTGHRTTMVTGLPSGTWRKLNYGVQPEKITTVQVTDAVGVLETYLECDKKIADLSGNVNKFRGDEAKFAIEGLSQTMATAMFYGDSSVEPEKFTGLDQRYNDLSAGNAGNIIDEGDSSTLTSIWLINWREDKVHGLYPKGAGSGINHRDLGEVTLQDGGSPAGNYQGYRSHLTWDNGLCVRDWRFIVRCCNIDNTTLVNDFATGPDLVARMIDMLETIESRDGMPIFYMNETVKKYLRHHIVNKSNVNLTLDTVGGKEQLAFDGVPIVKTDAIVNTETQVT